MTTEEEERLEDFLGLHQDIRIIYVVDGYEATLNDQDGQREVATGSGDTIGRALAELSKAI